MILIRPLHELVAATHSPFHPDGSLAPEIVEVQAAFLSANGIRTVFITGTTGESHSLTRDERLLLFRAWAAAGPAHGLNVIAHVGSNSIEDAKAFVRSARELEFAAVASLAPSYFKPIGVEALVAWCRALAQEAPDLPFYYYDIPVFTGISLPIEQFLTAASDQIPNLAGVKFSNPDLVSYRRCLDVGDGRFDLPWGIDEALLAALATGARGGVGSTYNWAPKLYFDLISAVARADFEAARRLQSLSIAMVDAISATGFMGTSKALMSRLGVPVGPARAPLENPAAGDVDHLMIKLDGLGFNKWGAHRRDPLVKT
jgi:N-acetylneuraminate lyase